MRKDSDGKCGEGVDGAKAETLVICPHDLTVDL